MPESERPTRTQESEWITVGGKKIEVKPEDAVEDKTREALPSVRGEKEKNTKASLQKEYIQPRDINKSLFHIRDDVVFDEYKKSGIVSGQEGINVKILCKEDNYIYSILKEKVFLKSELINGTHWDTSSHSYRNELLKSAGLEMFYANRTWTGFEPRLRELIQKTNSHAGYESTSTGVGNPIYNPLSEDKTVSQRIKEEEAKQHEEDTEDETKRDNS